MKLVLSFRELFRLWSLENFRIFFCSIWLLCVCQSWCVAYAIAGDGVFYILLLYGHGVCLDADGEICIKTLSQQFGECSKEILPALVPDAANKSGLLIIYRPLS